ncbi:hypothetical protein ACLOJK_007975 [Asimina triloba]
MPPLLPPLHQHVKPPLRNHSEPPLRRRPGLSLQFYSRFLAPLSTTPTAATSSASYVACSTFASIALPMSRAIALPAFRPAHQTTGTALAASLPSRKAACSSLAPHQHPQLSFQAVYHLFDLSPSNPLQMLLLHWRFGLLARPLHLLLPLHWRPRPPAPLLLPSFRRSPKSPLHRHLEPPLR